MPSKFDLFSYCESNQENMSHLSNQLSKTIVCSSSQCSVRDCLVQLLTFALIYVISFTK